MPTLKSFSLPGQRPMACPSTRRAPSRLRCRTYLCHVCIRHGGCQSMITVFGARAGSLDWTGHTHAHMTSFLPARTSKCAAMSQTLAKVKASCGISFRHALQNRKKKSGGRGDRGCHR